MEPFKAYGEKFCVLPWVHSMTRPHGTVLPCCINTSEISKPDGTPFFLFEDEFDEVWNSPSYQNFRKKMFLGESIPSCESCYQMEATEKVSYRQISNQWWWENDRESAISAIEQSKQNNFMVSSDPMSLDLRLGNSCNLGCRSCHPINSSFLGKEWNRLKQVNLEFEEFWNGSFYEWPQHKEKKEIPAWFSNEDFLSRLKLMLPKMKFLYLTGGEPLLVKGNHELVAFCVKEGFAKNMSLMLNTNLTVVREEFLENLKHFKHVQLFGSIDGFAAANEYLRYPSKWHIVEKNLGHFLQLPGNINITINIVLQFHNALNLTDLLYYLEKVASQLTDRKFNIDVSVLRDPAWLRASLLPFSVRAVAAQRLEAYLANSLLCKESDYSAKSISGIIELLRSEDEANSDLLAKNKRYTNLMDDHRETPLRAAFPELVEALGELT